MANKRKHWLGLNNCIFCKQPFIEVKKTREHVIPLSKIHKNNILNYTASCSTCNQLKGDRNAKEFAELLTTIKEQLKNTKDWKFTLKYAKIKPHIDVMINSAWKLYNKTHKSHKDYVGFINQIEKEGKL